MLWRRQTTRILALDVGDHWVGVALSDPAGILATPLTILERKGGPADTGTIADLIKAHEVERVVAGLPRAMDGSIGPQAEKVKAFVEILRSDINVPIEFRDERLSTVSAKRLMREARPRRDKKKGRDDAAAAAIILQGYLDEKRLQAGGSEVGDAA